jgi:hypothetical protein
MTSFWDDDPMNLIHLSQVKPIQIYRKLLN